MEGRKILVFVAVMVISTQKVCAAWLQLKSVKAGIGAPSVSSAHAQPSVGPGDVKGPSFHPTMAEVQGVGQQRLRSSKLEEKCYKFGLMKIKYCVMVQVVMKDFWP